MVQGYVYIYNYKIKQQRILFKMNRGKSQVRCNKLCDTIGKRTLDKVSKVSKTKKQHKEERTPKKQIIYNHINYGHLQSMQVLAKMLTKRVQEREKQWLMQFSKSIERERKIQQILSKNEDRHNDLRGMLQHLHQEQKNIIDKLKQNMDMSDENDIKEQVWKLYAHIFNCKNKDVIMKYPMDALTQIRKKMDEQKHVISLAFSTIEKLKTSDSEEETNNTFSQVLQEIDSNMCQIAQTRKIKVHNSELLKKVLELEKENLRNCKQMKKIQQQFECLVQDKLHLTNRLQQYELKYHNALVQNNNIKQIYQERFTSLNYDITNYKNQIHKLSEHVKEQFTTYNNMLIEACMGYEQRQQGIVQKQYQFTERLKYISAAHQHQIQRLNHDNQALVTKLQEQVTNQEIQINKYLKLVKELKQQHTDTKAETQSTLYQQMEILTAQNNQYKEQTQAQLHKYQQQVQEDQIQIQQYKQQIKQHKLLIQELQNNVQEMVRMKNSKQKQNNELKQSIVVSQSTKQATNNTIEQLNSRVAQLQKCITDNRHTHQLQTNQLKSQCGMLLQLKQKQIQNKHVCVQRQMMAMEDIASQHIQQQQITQYIIHTCTKVQEEYATKLQQFRSVIVDKLTHIQQKINNIMNQCKQNTQAKGQKRDTSMDKEQAKQQYAEQENHKQYYKILQQLLQQFCFNHLNFEWQRKLREIDPSLKEKVIKYRNKIAQSQSEIIKYKEENQELMDRLKTIKDPQHKSTQQQFPIIINNSTISLNQSYSCSLTVSQLLDQSNIADEVVILKQQLANCIKENKKLKEQVHVHDVSSDQDQIFDF